MRRHFGSFLLILLLTPMVFLLSACGKQKQEPFSFQNGLRFDMNKDEVIQFEEEKNEGNFHWTAYQEPDKYVNEDTQLFAISRYSDTSFHTAFAFNEEGILRTVVFSNGDFSRKRYDDIVRVMTEKYGNPVSSGLKFTKYPHEGMNAYEIEEKYKEYYDRYGIVTMNTTDYQLVNVNQYFVKVSGGYVDILAVLSSDRFLGKSYNPDGSDMMYQFSFSYSFIPQADYDQYVQKLKDKDEAVHYGV